MQSSKRCTLGENLTRLDRFQNAAVARFDGLSDPDIFSSPIELLAAGPWLAPLC
jgi:hypothetical protein